MGGSVTGRWIRRRTRDLPRGGLRPLRSRDARGSDDALQIGARHRVPGGRGRSTTAGHWIVSTYDAGGRGVPRLGAVLVGADPPGAERDRLQQQQAPAVPPGGERPAAVVRLPPRARADPLAAGIGATARTRPASGPQHYLDQVVERGECEFVHDLTCPVPAAVTLEWLGYPQRGVADVLGRLPRRLRVPGRARPSTGRPRRRTGRC